MPLCTLKKTGKQLDWKAYIDCNMKNVQTDFGHLGKKIARAQKDVNDVKELSSVFRMEDLKNFMNQEAKGYDLQCFIPDDPKIKGKGVYVCGENLPDEWEPYTPQKRDVCTIHDRGVVCSDPLLYRESTGIKNLLYRELYAAKEGRALSELRDENLLNAVEGRMTEKMNILKDDMEHVSISFYPSAGVSPGAFASTSAQDSQNQVPAVAVASTS